MKNSIDDLTLEDVYEFIEMGSSKRISPELEHYLHLLDKVRGMMNRIDKFANDEAIIKHLIQVDGLSRLRAKKLLNEAKEYFFNDKEVSRTAWRNFYASKLDKIINFAMMQMRDVADAAKIGKLVLDAMDARGLNEPEQEDLPTELFEKPVRIYSLDADVSEFTAKPNRIELAKIIDSFPELSEKEKMRIKQEALILPLKIFPDQHEDPRKQ